MPNGNYNFRSQFNYSYSAKAVSLRMSVSFAGSGAPTLVSNTGMGIASIARNGAGDYTITLTRAYSKLMQVSHVFNTAGTAAAPASPSMYIKADAVASTTPTLRVVFNAAGTATDPASGEVVLMEVVLNDSSLGY